MKKKNKTKAKYGLGLVGIILAGTMSWAFYSIINQGVKDILGYFNIVNTYAQGGIVIGAIALIFVAVGLPLYKIINRVVGKK